MTRVTETGTTLFEATLGCRAGRGVVSNLRRKSSHPRSGVDALVAPGGGGPRRVWQEERPGTPENVPQVAK